MDVDTQTSIVKNVTGETVFGREGGKGAKGFALSRDVLMLPGEGSLINNF
jgi:hypothetical protein